MTNTNLSLHHSFPLPPATLVIDMRGVNDDDLIEQLKIEVADLTSDMKVHQVQQWRYLADFLSFLPTEDWPIEQMSPEEVDTFRPQSKSHEPDTTTSVGSSTADDKVTLAQSGLTGTIDPSTLQGFSSSLFHQYGETVYSTNDRPTKVLQESVDKIIKDVDRIRNNRIVAVADLPRATMGSSIQDPTVRIIFLADAELPDSLANTAAYAAYLKEYSRRQERDGQQPMISTTVLCVNNSSEGSPHPNLRNLPWDDRWDHLDSLILSERYSQNLALIAGPVQAYLMELLLYVLLLVPPLKVDAPASDPKVPFFFSQNANQNTIGQRINLPLHTYLVGLAAVEHSARWGRRLLNYKVVERTVQIIKRDIQTERKGTKSVANIWLSDFFAQVQRALDQLPVYLPALGAISRAKGVIQPPSAVLAALDLGLTGKSTIRNLRKYLTDITRTYVSSSIGEGSAATRIPTLQDAFDNIPSLQQSVQEWANQDLDMKKKTPLAQALAQALQVLSGFFMGPTGAVPRAKLQLEELGNAISEFQDEHEQNAVNLLDKQLHLERNGNEKIGALQQHIEKFPYLSSVPLLKQLMAWLTLPLAFCLLAIASFVSIGWFRHLISYWTASASPLPMSTIATIVDSLFLTTVSPVAFVFWGVVLIVIFSIVLLFRGSLLNEKHSNLRIEVIFWLSSLMLALFGLLIILSIAHLATDSPSVAIISWLSFFPTIAIGLFLVAFVILALELGYFAWWYGHMRSAAKRLINELNTQHKKNVDEVAGFIGDSIALQLLSSTELTKGKESPGEYYIRIQELDKLLTNVLKHAQRQQELAKKHLALSTSETQPGTVTTSNGTWLNLHIREELLDIESLAHGDSSLMESLDRGMEELKEFSELLLRVMGEETPVEIEQQFKTRSTSQENLQQRDARVLMATLAAVILRFSTTSSVRGMAPLLERYRSIKDSPVDQPLAMKLLLETLGNKLSGRAFQETTSKSINSSQAEMNAMATDALAAWAQMLWEDKYPELDETLTLEGVMPKVVEDNDNGQRVKKLLAIRTSLFGRSFQAGQIGDLYVLLPPSPQSHQFRQSLKLQKQQIIDFPDIERLILLYIQRYKAEPLFVPESEPEPGRD